MVKLVAAINFTLKCMLLVKIPNFPLFGSCDLFSYFQDLGHLGNRIWDIGFRILTFKILEFEILVFGGMEFGNLDCSPNTRQRWGLLSKPSNLNMPAT